MPKWVSEFTPEQREAAAVAYRDKGMTARQTADAAAAGELRLNGEPVPAFTANPNTVRTWANQLDKKRQGKKKTRLSDLPPRDAVEALRRRLLNAADGVLAFEECKKAPNRDLERLRQVARCVREVQAIPGPDEQRRLKPGQKAGGDREGAVTEKGMAGKILHDMRGGGPVRDNRSSETQDVDGTDGSEQALGVRIAAALTEGEVDGVPGSPALAFARSV